MDYGSLIWVTLQRAKTAREAIQIMDNLCQTYGYASDGESFSIADANEVFLMELIGKGKYGKGAVWVAFKVPEGFVGSTANQARIRTFPRDSADVLYSKDVVTFAQEVGLYPKDADAQDFSFSDIYDPVTFTGVRLGETRVWNLFNQIGGPEVMAPYLDYAQGKNLSNRMPLFVEAKHPLSVNDTMWHMRTHFENTWFDNRGIQRPDVGAGSGNSAYRWRPLVWSHEGKHYVNERTIGVQQTAWNFVAQSRGWLPKEVSGIIWWAPDDSATAVRIPVYACSTRIPPSFGDPIGQEPAAKTAYGPKADAFEMSLDSAFWVWNLVANIAYGERYADTYPLIQAEINKYESRFFTQVAQQDKIAAKMVEDGKSTEAVELMTVFSVSTGEQMTKDWRTFWMRLFSRTRDGFTTIAPTTPTCRPGQKENCTSRPLPSCQETGYTDAWYQRMVSDSDNAEHYRVPDEEVRDPVRLAMNVRKLQRMEKKRI